MKKALLIFPLFISTFFAFSQLTVTSGQSASNLINAFVKQGITVTNVVLNGSTNAYGTFSNGGTTNIGLSSGAIFTTGLAQNVKGPNNSGSVGTCNGNSVSDPQLTAISPNATEDLVTLEFDFKPQGNYILLDFVFGSEEYPEFVNASYNDGFGIFLTGNGPACQSGYYNSTNIATLPNNTPVSINSVNAGINSSYYINNIGGATIQYDGFTAKISKKVFVCASQTYHLKIAIADAGDCYYDSALLIESLASEPVLSVQLADFSAKAENGFVKIDWKTSSEKSNKAFLLERAGEAGKFEHLTTLNGNLNSLTSKNYSFYDRLPLNGLNYYKLIQIDEDGTKTELGVKSVDFKIENLVSIFPNPVKDKLNVSFKAGVYQKLFITDLQGKSLLTSCLSPSSISHEIDLQNFVKGIYIIKLKGVDRSEISKLVKL